MRRESGVLDQPHPTLYPAIFGPDGQMLPQARLAFIAKFFEVVQPVIPDIRNYVRFAVIGSGACYNWDEDGDFDIQVWVSDEEALPEVRRLIVKNLLGLKASDFGLDGTMEIQFYAKPGRGTPEENLEGQPYACYDLDLDKWLVEPFPLTPEMYGDLFLLVEPRADEMAREADELLAEYERTRRDVEYWTALGERDAGYEERITRARVRMKLAYDAAKAYFNQMMLMRGEAYKPGGRGIFDDRDAIWKLLEVWGVKDRMKNLAHGKPGVVV